MAFEVIITDSIGDTGEGDDPTEGELVKLAEDEFALWASGRQGCTGMLVHINVISPSYCSIPHDMCV